MIEILSRLRIRHLVLIALGVTVISILTYAMLPSEIWFFMFLANVFVNSVVLILVLGRWIGAFDQ